MKNPEQHQRLVNDALAKFSFTKPEKQTAITLLFAKLTSITQTVKRRGMAVIESKGGIKNREQLDEFKTFVYDQFLSEFKGLSEDEKICLLAHIHMNVMTENLDSYQVPPI